MAVSGVTTASSNVIGSFINHSGDLCFRYALGPPRGSVNTIEKVTKSLVTGFSSWGFLEHVSLESADADVFVLLESPTEQSFHSPPKSGVRSQALGMALMLRERAD